MKHQKFKATINLTYLATVWNLQALKLFWIRLIYAIQIDFFSLSDLPPSLLHSV
jgi:hypothetical protein